MTDQILITKVKPLDFLVERAERALTKIPDREKAKEIHFELERSVKNEKRSVLSRILSVLWIILKSVPSIIAGLMTMSGKQLAASIAAVLAGILNAALGLTADWVIPGTEINIEWILSTILIALGTWLLPGLFEKKLNPAKAED